MSSDVISGGDFFSGDVIGGDICQGPEQFVSFSFRSVHFFRMKLQFSSIPYSPTIENGDRLVRLAGFGQKVHELFRPWICHW